MRRREALRAATAAVIVLALLVLWEPAAAAATVLRVPQDFPTIQAAIDAAAAGDTVLVAPGTYVERIDFQAKEITVERTSGPASTIIDGNLTGTVVRLVANPGQTPVLRGFTVRNGLAGAGGAGGIETFGGPALIEGNWVSGNISPLGGGITADTSSATIRSNIISGNQPSGSGGPGGGGILIRGAGTVNVLNNEITGNRSNSDGGGISLFAAGSPTISGNVISDNAAGIRSPGGGITLGNLSNAVITNNVIVGNTAFHGGGIAWLVPAGQPGPDRRS